MAGATLGRPAKNPVSPWTTSDIDANSAEKISSEVRSSLRAPILTTASVAAGSALPPMIWPDPTTSTEVSRRPGTPRAAHSRSVLASTASPTLAALPAAPAPASMAVVSTRNPSVRVAVTLYVVVGGPPRAPEARTRSGPSWVSRTSRQSQLTSAIRYAPGSPISYSTCSATVATDTSPPVPAGLVITAVPSAKHSATG